MHLDPLMSRDKASGRVSLSGGVEGTKSPPPPGSQKHVLQKLLLLFVLSLVLHSIHRKLNELFSNNLVFLPLCMECRRGLAMRILSVRLSVCHTRGV